MIIDGNSLINRAYYGVRPLTTKDGRFTHAIHGFLNMLLKLSDTCQPTALAVAFDLPAPTFRHMMYDAYKAGRKGMPEELAQQMPVLQELLPLLGYSVIAKEGYEADDILGTFAKHCRQEDHCFIATGDRDALQLVDDKVTVLLTTTKMGRPQMVEYDTAQVKADYQVRPAQLIAVKALMGDSSDNIPGVAGIGQKTATDLIVRFGSLDAIYQDLDTLDIKPGVREKLRNGKEDAYMSRDLGTIYCDVPIPNQAEAYRIQKPQVAKAMALLADLEMFKMIERFHFTDAALPAESQKKVQTVSLRQETDPDALLVRLRTDKQAYFLRREVGYYFALTDQVVLLSEETSGFAAFQKAFVEEERILKYTDDLKAFYREALLLDLQPAGGAGDTAIAAYVLNPSASGYQLDRLVQEYDVKAAVDPQDETAALTAALPKLFAGMQQRIAENQQEELLAKIELPLSAVLAQMEVAGFRVDADGIRAFGETLQGNITQIEQDIYQQVGYDFNLNSPKQLGEALFVKLGLPTRKKTKTGYSTNAEVLESLINEHPVIELILEYRQLAKLKSTYCDGLLKVIAADGRIHSTLNQTETRTGRISSTEPNLQNIPVRSDLGREMRRFFLAQEGHVLVDADYSQIELRVLADIANDPVMIQAFNEQQDIHTITASQVFRMPQAMVTPLMRSRAKAVNFGIVYGIGAFSLSQDIGVSRAEADEYIRNYLHHYAGVAQYMEEVVAQAKRDGYVTTLFGRRRYLPELTASNFNTRAFGERVARNMPIQGTAADIIKVAMIRVAQRLQNEGFAAKLILQVHDELIVEAPEEEAQAVAALLQEEMESAAKLQVQLTVDVHIGKTWYDAKE